MEVIKRCAFALLVVTVCPAIILLLGLPFLLIGPIDFGTDYEETKLVVHSNRAEAASEVFSQFGLTYPSDLTCTAFEHGSIGFGYMFKVKFEPTEVDTLQLAQRIAPKQASEADSFSDDEASVKTGYGGVLWVSREETGIEVLWTND